MSLMLLILGTTLTAISWAFAWSNAGIMSEYSFFPLWIGYILTINGIGEAAYRTSLIRVMRWYLLALFIASIPLWWFFEVVNGVVHNWEYILPHPISGLHYVIQASTNFATVLPAVLSTAFVAHWMLRGYGLYQVPEKATHAGDSQNGADVIHRGKRVGVCHGCGDWGSRGLRGRAIARAGEAVGRCQSDAALAGAGGDL